MTATDHPDKSLESNLRLARNVVLKGVFLFLIANLVFAFWYPLASLGRVSTYNRLFPGRMRLPYGDNPHLFLRDSEQGLTWGVGFHYGITNVARIKVDYGFADYGRLKNVQY